MHGPHCASRHLGGVVDSGALFGCKTGQRLPGLTSICDHRLRGNPHHIVVRRVETLPDPGLRRETIARHDCVQPRQGGSRQCAIQTHTLPN